MVRRRFPCLMKHDGYPGVSAKFMGPDSNLLEDFELRVFKDPDGDYYTTIVNVAIEKALHFHEREVEE